MRVLALDFDGVISDSAPEAFVVALRTLVALRPGTSLAGPLAPLLGDLGVGGPGVGGSRTGGSEVEGRAGPAPTLDQVEAEPLYAPFIEHMPLGNRAEDYASVLCAIETGTPLPDQAAYDTYRGSLDPAFLREYHRRFYRVRAALAESDPDGWRRLMAAYPGVPELLRRRAGDVLLAIATSKDRRSVRALLHLYGIDDLFPEALVLDKETGADKSAHLARLSEDHGFDYHEMTFIDDKVNHLDAVAPTGARCALAAWGYNGAREVALAAERNYLVCDLEHLEIQLFG